MAVCRSDSPARNVSFVSNVAVVSLVSDVSDMSNVFAARSSAEATKGE